MENSGEKSLKEETLKDEGEKNKNAVNPKKIENTAEADGAEKSENLGAADNTEKTNAAAADNAEKSKNGNSSGLSGSVPPKKKHKELSRGTQVAIGASITAVLLALIITIIVVAVQTASKMTQIYATNFSGIYSDVRDGKFIGSIDGDYYLMDGDKRVSGPYLTLRWEEDYNGYVFKAADGKSGLLNYSGEKQLTTMGDELYSMEQAEYFTRGTATFVDGSKIVTISLKTKEVIEELNGLLPKFTSDSNEYFVWGGDYCKVKTTAVNGSSMTMLTFQGVNYSLEGLGINAKVVSHSPFVVNVQNTNVCFYDGAASAGNYYTVSVENGKNDTLLTVAANKIYINGKLSDVSAEVVYSKAGYIQADKNIYKLNGDELALAKANAYLVKMTGEKDFYFGTDTVLYSSEGKELTKFTGKWSYIGKGLVYENGTVRSFDSSKKIDNVAKIVYPKNVNNDELGAPLMQLNSGEVSSIDGIVYTLDAISSVGAFDGIVYSSAGGYIIKGINGWYTSGGIQIRGDVYLLGDPINPSSFVAFNRQRIETYQISKNKIKLDATYYYSGTTVVTAADYKHGIVFKDDNGLCGVISDDGKLAVKPQYKNIDLYANYMSVSIDGSIYAMSSPSGNLITDFLYTGIEGVSEYALVEKMSGEVNLITSTGKEVLYNITSIYEMGNYVLKDNNWEEAEDFGYWGLVSGDGIKVMRFKLDM